MRDLIPEHPHDAGIPEQVPDLAQIEGARLLANEAVPVLEPMGFARRQVREWAETYIAIEHSGDLDCFLEWVYQQELAHGDIR